MGHHHAQMIPDPIEAERVPAHLRPPRTMFVTVGATASFKALVEEVLSEKFLQLLKRLNFNRLYVQCGPDLDHFEAMRRGFGPSGVGAEPVEVILFDYTKEIMGYMLKCTPNDGRDGPMIELCDRKEVRSMGIIVSHAGAGTILDALNVNAKLVVVPNPTLMDDHQTELAKELQKQGLLVWGHLGRVEEAVERIDKHSPAHWPPRPPSNSIYPNGLEDVVRDVTSDVVHVPLTRHGEERDKDDDEDDEVGDREESGEGDEEDSRMRTD